MVVLSHLLVLHGDGCATGPHRHVAIIIIYLFIYLFILVKSKSVASLSKGDKGTFLILLFALYSSTTHLTRSPA